MGGAYCSAYGCLNSQLGNPEKSFFRLPKEPEKLAEWLPLIGREDLLDPAKKAKTCKRICCDHFDIQDYKLTKKLKKNRVPHLKLVNFANLDKNEIGQKTELEQKPEIGLEPKLEPKPSTSTQDSDLFISLHSHQVQETQKYNVLTQTTCEMQDISTQTSTLEWHSLKEIPWTSSVATQVSFPTKYPKMPKKKSEKAVAPMPIIDNNIFLRLSEIFLDKRLSDIVKCHLSKTSNGSRYTDEFKSFVRELYLCSPRAYKLLQQFFNLPSIRTIQRVISNSAGVNVKVEYSSNGSNEPETTETENNEEVVHRNYVQTSTDITVDRDEVETSTGILVGRNEVETSIDIMVGRNEVETSADIKVGGSEAKMCTDIMADRDELETSTDNIVGRSKADISTHIMVSRNDVETCTDNMIGRNGVEMSTNNYMLGRNGVEISTDILIDRKEVNTSTINWIDDMSSKRNICEPVKKHSLEELADDSVTSNDGLVNSFVVKVEL